MEAPANLAMYFFFGRWLCVLAFPIIAILIVVVILVATRSSRANTPPSAFPVLPTGPGTYVIRGVYRATRADAIWRVEADSEANARIKAELEGIIVASVSFEGKRTQT